MTTHILKTWPEYFQEIWNGYKNFELRKNDRNYQANDHLILKEYDPAVNAYSGRMIECDVSYILYGGKFNLPDDLCIMSLENMELDWSQAI